MNKSIPTFLAVLFLLVGIATNASDGSTVVGNDLRSQFVIVAGNPFQKQKPSFTTSRSNFTTILLIAIGLVGLTGVNRNNDS